MAGLRAGELDRRITLERFTATQDPGSGEEVQAWDTLATVWASKKDISDGERFAASEVQAAISTRFVIRYSSQVADLNAKDRLVCEGHTYQVVGVKETGRRREGLEISALRGND
jgi:SPP1 family predicted phage head-tail adaptor